MHMKTIWNKSYVNCGYEIKWRMILAVIIICIIHLHIFHGNIWTQNWPAPNVSGFIAQLVERRTGIARSRVQAPLKSWIFFRLLYAIAKIAIITARIILHLMSFPCQVLTWQTLFADVCKEKLGTLQNLLVCTGWQGKLVKKIVVRCVIIELLATVNTCQRKLVHSFTPPNKLKLVKENLLVCNRLKHEQMKIINDTCQGKIARV